MIKRLTRHSRRDGAFSLLIGQFEFRDASVAAVLNSASQQALLDAALRDSASYLELWNLYNDKEWQSALQQAETMRSLRFVQCEGCEDGRENLWRPDSEVTGRIPGVSSALAQSRIAKRHPV